jgi:ABC-type uncharacterized transport system substrate-binding protein
MVVAVPLAAEAQQPRVYRVGVILQGGPYLGAVDGLRKGLEELGLEEGKQLIFHVRDGKSDLKAAEQAAADLERERVDLMYAVSTSVTLAVKRETKTTPVVFYTGIDRVAVAAAPGVAGVRVWQITSGAAGHPRGAAAC